MNYVPIYQVECSLCPGSPVVGIRTPTKVIVCTSLCADHFFGEKGMSDPEEWNKSREATE